MSRPTDEEIRAVLARNRKELEPNGGDTPDDRFEAEGAGITQGVVAALEWVLGEGDARLLGSPD